MRECQTAPNRIWREEFLNIFELFCSSMESGIPADSPNLVLLFFLAQLFLRELHKSKNLVRVVPMDMTGYFGKYIIVFSEQIFGIRLISNADSNSYKTKNIRERFFLHWLYRVLHRTYVIKLLKKQKKKKTKCRTYIFWYIESLRSELQLIRHANLVEWKKPLKYPRVLFTFMSFILLFLRIIILNSQILVIYLWSNSRGNTSSYSKYSAFSYFKCFYDFFAINFGFQLFA